MLDKIFSSKIAYYLDLIRFYNPIGFMLLMWPSWFALALLPNKNIDLIYWYLLFLIGAFLMRSAGCIINDLIDIDIDNKIKRTAFRPLTSRKISIKESIFFLLFLLFLSLIILYQFNIKSILIGLFSFPFILLYPLMKRYTHWPQLVLGIIFSWGVILVSTEFLDFFSWNYILLYIGCILWTLAYDTIYAYQDIEDDIKFGIKSTAVLFKKKGIHFVKLFYLGFFLIIGYLAWKTSNNIYSLLVIIIYIFAMNLILNKWDMKSRNNSNYYFKFNNIVGLSCFTYLLIF